MFFYTTSAYCITWACALFYSVIRFFLFQSIVFFCILFFKHYGDADGNNTE